LFDQHLLAAPLSIPAFFNEVLQLLREVILHYELLWSRMVLIDNLEKYINHKVETLQTTRIISFSERPKIQDYPAKARHQTFMSFSRVKRAIASRWSSLAMSNVVKPLVAIAVFSLEDFLPKIMYTMYRSVICSMIATNQEICLIHLRDYLQESVQCMDKILFWAVLEELH